MDNDDEQVGRILTRREALALFGVAGATLLAGCGGNSATTAPTSAASAATASPTLNAEAATSVVAATQAAPVEATTVSAPLPNCVVSPMLTEGPYFVDQQLNRSDIRSDPGSDVVKQGTPLVLTMNVRQVSAGSCTALSAAIVDIWHCDAAGVYSGVSDRGSSTAGQMFLRGQQVSDAAGSVTFTTIFPGWYPGRAVHIHFKVRTAAGATQSHEFTSQLFFDDAQAIEIFAQPPYASKGPPDTPNSRDGIFRSSGDQLLVALAKAGQGYAGYAGTFDIGIQL